MLQIPPEKLFRPQKPPKRQSQKLLGPYRAGKIQSQTVLEDVWSSAPKDCDSQWVPHRGTTNLRTTSAAQLAALEGVHLLSASANVWVPLDELTYPTWGARGKPDDVSCWPKTNFAWHFPAVSRYGTVRLPVFVENLAPRLWQVSIYMFKTHTVTCVLPKSTHNILVIQPTIKQNMAWTGKSPEQFLKIKDNSSPYLTPSNVGLPLNVQQKTLFDVNMWHIPKNHHQTSIHVWHVNQ